MCADVSPKEKCKRKRAEKGEQGSCWKTWLWQETEGTTAPPGQRGQEGGTTSPEQRERQLKKQTNHKGLGQKRETLSAGDPGGGGTRRRWVRLVGGTLRAQAILRSSAYS